MSKSGGINWSEDDLREYQNRTKLGVVGQNKPVAVESNKSSPARQQITKDGDGMNKTERAFSQILNLRKFAGEILDWKFEAVKLKLATQTTYTPDFLVITLEGKVQFFETKGFWRDDARVKIKVAAAMFPYFKFIACTVKKGVWSYEYF